MVDAMDDHARLVRAMRGNMAKYTQSDYDLDYLFVAEKFDGSLYKQTPDDKPRFSSWGSSFTDIQHEKLRRFSLIGKGHVYTIDLIDGHLEIDGHKLYPPHEVLPGIPLKLIYWRTVTRDFLVGPDGGPVAPKVKYVIGWQYNCRGKNIDWQLGIE